MLRWMDRWEKIWSNKKRVWCCFWKHWGGGVWNRGRMENEWSEAGTNDGCAQGHTNTAVSPPNFSNVRSA